MTNGETLGRDLGRVCARSAARPMDAAVFQIVHLKFTIGMQQDHGVAGAELIRYTNNIRELDTLLDHHFARVASVVRIVTHRIDVHLHVIGHFLIDDELGIVDHDHAAYIGSGIVTGFQGPGR